MPDKSGNPTDYPRDQIMAMAQDAITGKRAEVYFKFTCAHCGQRCTLAEPNRLYASGECNYCGKVTIIERAGFMLVVAIDRPPSPKKEDTDGDEQGSTEGPAEGR